MKDIEIYDITIIGGGPVCRGKLTVFYAGLRQAKVKLQKPYPSSAANLACFMLKKIYMTSWLPSHFRRRPRHQPERTDGPLQHKVGVRRGSI